MTCPFCGVEADVPHETQKACIQALNAEIVRVRAILEHLRPAPRVAALTGPRGPSATRFFPVLKLLPGFCRVVIHDALRLGSPALTASATPV